jgi:HAMP domain-containing protein
MSVIRRARPIRTHILFIVLCAGILPLTLIGVWLTASAVRSGKALLREQLTSSLEAISNSVRSRWMLRQGDLLLLADNLAARHAVSSESSGLTAEDSAYLAGLYRQVARTIPSFTYVDASGRERWSSIGIARTEPTGPRPLAAPTTMRALFATHDDSGRVLGHLDARVAVDAVVSPDSTNLGVPGAVLVVRDSATGTSLASRERESLFGRDGEVRSGDTTWMVVRGRLDAPPLELAIGAPTAAFVSPFQGAARTGLAAVLVVALIALATSAYLTTRVTGPIDRLVDAASGVSRGDLERHVDVEGPREVETLAASFNAITGSLRRILS